MNANKFHSIPPRETTKENDFPSLSTEIFHWVRNPFSHILIHPQTNFKRPLFRKLDGWELDKKDCTLYYSCQEKAHYFRVGFIVNKRLRNTVIDFQAISMRLCKIRLRGRHYNTILICAYAPTDDKDKTEKDLFYDLLMKSYNSCPAQDMKLVIRDFNAKIRRELFISSNVGLHSLHKETNENGQTLAFCCIRKPIHH
ncbi:craniofacial development protein 2 [Trichonephila clavipes]|nr:craniofacial development protein 2 [Trichonephila clavipes]